MSENLGNIQRQMEQAVPEAKLQMISDAKPLLSLLTHQLPKGLVGAEATAEVFADTVVLAGGHLILEGDPGGGKTRLAENFSHMVYDSTLTAPNAQPTRILGRFQGVPDRQPSDVIGIEVYNRKTDEYEIKNGPVMSHFMLADELNRNNPKTQSALNQAMQEGEVTIGTETIALPELFTVIATQNAYSLDEGTQKTGSALRDRFDAQVEYAIPTSGQRRLISRQFADGVNGNMPKRLLTLEKVKELRDLAQSLDVMDTATDEVADTFSRLASIEDLTLTSRTGVRPIQAGIRLARARALRLGDSVVNTDHVRAVMPHVLRNRMVTYKDDLITDKEIVEAMLGRVIVGYKGK